MRIARICFLIFGAIMLAGHLFAQVPSGQLKVRNSGLFGLKGERFARVELSSKNRTQPPSDIDVNAGECYYFLFSAVGEWALDADFVKEEIPKLTVVQNDRTIQIGWKSDFGTDSTAASILIGFPKELKLHLPFSIQFAINGDSSKAEITVPQEYWPGYSALTGALKDAAKAATDKRYRDAIAIYERLMLTDSLRIFSQFNELKDRRTQCFDGYVNETWAAFQTTSRGTTPTLKEKISGVDQIKPLFQFAVDSLPNALLKVASDEAPVKVILDRAESEMRKGVDVPVLMPGARVRPAQSASEVHVGEELLGRVLDGTGRPLDGLGPVHCRETQPLMGQPLNPLKRWAIREPLDVGVRE